MSPNHLRASRIALWTLAIPSFVFLLAGLATAAEDERPSRLGQPSSIESIRESALAGDFVTVQGEILGGSGNRVFELRDDTGMVLVLIPDHVQRDLGAPKKNETVRVFGRWDHDPSMAPERAEAQADGRKAESTWGIRVQKLERNLSSSSRNPIHSLSDEEPLPTRKPASSTPAAIEASAQVHNPQVDAELKQRLAAAKDKVIATQTAYDDASGDYARAVHRGVEGAELERLELRSTNARAAYADAASAIPPLTAEAREAGIDESLIRIYENGITPAR